MARARHVSQLFNRSGSGSGRFSPMVDVHGAGIGHVYAGVTSLVALLETTFHEVGPGRTNQIDVATDLQGWHQRLLAPQRPLRLADLRDNQLEQLGVARSQVIATTPAHYACTREWAQRIVAWRALVDGIVWNSRLAEVVAGRSELFGAMQQTDYAEAIVIYDTRLSEDDLVVEVDPEDLASRKRGALVDTMANLLDVPIL